MAVFVPLISLAGMIPVSVNGLGVREALYIFFFGRLGAPTEVSVSLALLYLAVTFIGEPARRRRVRAAALRRPASAVVRRIARPESRD